MLHILKQTLSTLVIIFNLAGNLWADAPSGSTAATGNPAQHHALTTPVNKASDASFDKRLPPVLPGEELSDSGKTVKVWSSSGPVPDNMQAPVLCAEGQTNCANSNANIGAVDVIIDRNRDFRRPKTSDSWDR